MSKPTPQQQILELERFSTSLQKQVQDLTDERDAALDDVARLRRLHQEANGKFHELALTLAEAMMVERQRRNAR